MNTSIDGTRGASARRWKKAVVTVGIAALVLASNPSMATQLGLATSPLFLSATAPANIFFLSDDSGSMDWNMVTTETDGAMYLTAGGHTTGYHYLYPDSDNAYSDTNTNGRIILEENDVPGSNTPADKYGVWRARYSGYNKLFYNPNINYKPWPGVDSAGNPLPNAKALSTDPSYIPVTAIRLNPFNASSGTTDLTATVNYTSNSVPLTDGTTTNVSAVMYRARYFTWDDTNLNGVVDADDGHTMYEINPGSCHSSNCPATFIRSSARTDCAIDNGDGTRTCTVTEELNNFANWYMYDRRRILTAKNAIGSVIAPKGSEVRMGHASINNNAGNSNIQIAAMNTSVASGNKLALMNTVYKMEAGNSTPLRDKLYQTGNYFECTSGSIFGGTSSYTCPWLSSANGGTCQQSFTIMMTDGFYNDSFGSGRFSLSLPGNGNADADGSSPNGSGNTPYDGGAYADSYGNTLADIAMWFYERDLRSNLANNVPVIAGIDNNTAQHMVTYTVAFGVNGTLSSSPTDPTAAFSWPNPSSGDAEKIDDLRHAAYDGRGQFLSASDPTTLSTALQTSIDNITERTGSASAVAVNSRALNTGSALYQARFTSVEWSGDLRAISLDPSTGDVGAQLWSAKDQLNLQTPGSRVILTYRQKNTLTADCASDASTNGGVGFEWANLSGPQQCYLNDDPTTGTFDNDAKGNLRLAYLRGDASQEGTNTGQFRERGFKLGDIINSTPIYVAEPTPLPDTLESVAHSGFASTYSSRRQMIYVGANDGMLHGFDANTGNEKIAYVPSQVYANLGKLTDPNYRNNHRYYVDGNPTVGDAFGNFANGCSGSACWRSILVSGMAGGAKGIFALDVTDPDGAFVGGLRFSEADAADLVPWEFIDSASATPDNDMGYIYGEVSIAKMHNGQWAAIFGNGYNSANENSVLYFVDVVTGALIKKIVLNPYGPATGNSNGLSAPAVFDADNDFIADYIYAGDLRGNLWKIDVTNPNPALWGSPYTSGGKALPMFSAKDGTTGSAKEQPITARPVVRVHPAGQPGYMVYVGTGRYVTDSDKNPASSPLNSFYGIWDQNAGPGSSTPVARSNLLVQTITQTNGVRIVSSNVMDWSTYLGFATNLRTDQADSLGEMSVTNPVLATASPERLIFTTLVPNQNICSFGGSGWLMEISPINGGNLGQSVFDTNNDGVIDTADTVNGGFVSGIDPGLGIMPEPVIVFKDGPQPLDLKLLTGSTGDVKSIKNYLTPPAPGPGAGTGRRSWRQLQ
jgi:type IV pilus assembly protein PilY1